MMPRPAYRGSKPSAMLCTLPDSSTIKTLYMYEYMPPLN